MSGKTNYEIAKEFFDLYVQVLGFPNPNDKNMLRIIDRQGREEGLLAIVNKVSAQRPFDNSARPIV